MLNDRTTFSSIAIATIPRRGRAREIVGTVTGSAGITRRHLQVALGLLWLLDGALQAQPFMFTRGFATQVIAATGQGQPGFVAAPIDWAANVVAAHPAAWNVPFAAIQLLLGVGLLVPRTARLTLAASIAWALGVWYLGEGLSGLASGHASLITGAPGSALLYAFLAAAAWPGREGSREGPAPWLPFAWAAVWVGAAVFQALPGQNSGTAVASALTGGTVGAPAWLASLDSSAGAWTAHHGLLLVILLVTTEALIGVGALARRTRMPSVTLGLALTLAIWVLGQDLGALYTRQATDPNSGPALALMAAALLGARRRSAPARVILDGDPRRALN
jgi:MYXO-CTERM domain-containing protein